MVWFDGEVPSHILNKVLSSRHFSCPLGKEINVSVTSMQLCRLVVHCDASSSVQVVIRNNNLRDYIKSTSPINILIAILFRVGLFLLFNSIYHTHTVRHTQIATSADRRMFIEQNWEAYLKIHLWFSHFYLGNGFIFVFIRINLEVN